ncbi:DNA-directed DNA polymerase [Hymenobacter roseosalivarius DSM 11622]|uniref:DNA polymerase IV n=1 Tax=Hymenobacter roseosalivarius DSM 11622 TaxID=645990 RepID=A0A1W1W617_9BACT|nr:DNA polymerase IV [Hymenobacter roseosalivarius]SMC00554.1 DNA-directed DNA polymerase [Hymenobacter roseosalivarius DSM 11622]
MEPQPEYRRIIHLDMDAFYASVEQRDDPALRGRPVAVGGSRQRGVVAAASYEAREFGVRSAMASSVALRKCPELVFVKPRFEVYKTVSRQIRAIFAEYTPLIEPVSLDEAYLDVTHNLKQIASATQVAQQIRAAILAETQLTASAGISYNKFLAKLASNYRKPNGQFVIRPHQGLALVAELAVGQFHGIGPVTAARMNQLGIFTGLDLRQQSEAFLRQHFGKAGSYYYAIARAQDNRPVVADRVRKSIGSETTFEQDLATYDDLVAGLAPGLESVWGYCQRTETRGRTITVKVKYADFQQITRSRTSLTSVDDKAMLEKTSLELLAGLLPLAQGVRLLGVALSNLETEEVAGRQLVLIF